MRGIVAKLIKWTPWPVPALLGPAFVVYLLGAPASAWLRYDRDAIFAGQLWRLVTGHFVHLSGLHLLLNAAATLLILVGFIAPGQPSFTRMFTALLGLMLGVSIGLLVGSTDVEWYVGLSGILHGLTVLVAVWYLERRFRLVLIAGLLVKLAWEQTAGAESVFGFELGGAVIVDAHLYGVLTAFLLLCLFFVVAKINAAKTPG